MKYLFLLLLVACSPEHEPEDKKDLPALSERDRFYCEESETIYRSLGQTIEKDCDAALFTSLHGLACGYVDPSVFEYEKTGKLCRRPGCTCFDNKQAGQPTSDSGFSKDMAAGMQLFYATNPDKALAVRVQQYGNANKWTVCDAEDATTLLSKCVMSPKIIYRWAQIEKKASSQPTAPEDDGQALVGKTDFHAHLEVLGILTELKLYGGISSASLAAVKQQAAREPNNLLFQALLAKFVNGDEAAVADRLLAKFPADRLPTSADWCTPYLYQRDERRGNTPNKDWLPCPDAQVTHPGTDYLLASWVLQLGG